MMNGERGEGNTQKWRSKDWRERERKREREPVGSWIVNGKGENRPRRWKEESL